MNYTFTFQETLTTRLEISGGKGSNLAILTQRNFPVPPGFVIAAKAYREFISADGNLLSHVDQLPFHDAGLLRTESEKLRLALGRLSLPSSVEEEVRQQLGQFPAGQTFSVRSSSTMEDLASAAFAGQHETYLNCSGADHILEKIKECFLSLWFDRAIAYRHQQGMDHSMAAMAVVVQQMVQCDVAGVGFSINPVSGDLTEIVVDANFGLGESVVSGDGEVDHIVIDRTSRAVRSATIAGKSRKIIGVPGGGTREARMEKEVGALPCLDELQLSQLTDLLLRVEAGYRFPQDIEWGFAGGQLFLLQSRPITTIPPRWTRDESAERFPNVLTPLTWDFVDSGFHRSLNHSFRLMGFPPFNGKWFGMHGHYIYGNQNAVELYGGRTPFTARNIDELRAALPKLREEYRWVQELPVAWARDLDFYLISIGKFMTEALADKSLPELWQFVLSVNEHGAAYFLPNIAISITHGAICRLLHGLLQLSFGKDTANSLFDRLMAYCETKTGTINKELFEMAAMIRASPKLEEALGQRSSRDALAEGLLEKYPEVHLRLQKFLRDHGHREVDFDAYSPTWIEIPWVVLDNVRLILQTPMEQDPSAREREMKIRAQEAELELLQQIPPDLRYFFAEILRLARAYTSLDDLEHYQTTRLTLPLRRGLREMGERLVERGVLGDPMDIFFGHLEQIDKAIAEDSDSGWEVFKETISRQKADYLRDKARKPEWILGETKVLEPVSGDCLSGLAGSSGQADGPVFLVLSPDDFAKFPKGAVLVARTTNPTWTPLFYSAVAVVTESGGPLSHGAVTAREMRIPAVMSVRESLTRLTNGRRVRVDGTQGKVYLL